MRADRELAEEPGQPSVPDLLVRIADAGLGRAEQRRERDLVAAVPDDRRLQCLLKINRVLKAQALELAAVERVTAVVPRPVGDVLDQCMGFAKQLQQRQRQVDVTNLAVPAEVVDLTNSATAQSGRSWASRQK